MALPVLKPRRPTRVQTWCDEYLYLSPRVSSVPGPWKTSEYPHQRGIMEMWSHQYVEILCLMWATRLGKTVMVGALIAWASRNDPGPAMVVGPDYDTVKSLSEEKLQPMLDYVDDHNEYGPDGLPDRLMLKSRKERKWNRVDIKDMLAYMAWSGSPSQLGDKSVRYMFEFELDKWSTAGGKDGRKEADPEDLADNRVKDWWNSKTYKEGTPTLEGLSRIDENLKTADVVMQYQVPCVRCGRFQLLVLGSGGDSHGVHWEKNKSGKSEPGLARDSAYYVCEYCSAKLTEPDRIAMLHRGVWAPVGHHVPDDTKALVLWGSKGPQRKVGTQLSSLYSPIFTLGQFAEAFVRAKGDQGKMQDFKNGTLGETFAFDYGQRGWAEVRDRLTAEEPRGIVPSWAVAMTAGIDVGLWDIYYAIRAWGPGGKSQLVEASILHTEGNVQGGTRGALGTILGRGFEVYGGGQRTVDLACIDVGYEADDIYAEIAGYPLMPPQAVRAIRGNPAATSAKAPWVMTVIEMNKRTGRKYPGGRKLFQLYSQHWQGFVNGKLRKDANAPDAFLFHANPPQIYLEMLCNVVPIPQKTNRGQTQIVYKVVDMNLGDHFHDAECYAAAAADMIGVLRLPVKDGPKIITKPRTKSGKFKNFKIRRKKHGKTW